MQSQEIIRSLFITIIGASLVFLIQPWLYQNVIVPTDIEIDTWIRDKYAIGATILFAITILAQFLWFVISVRFRGDDREAKGMLIPWLGLLIFSIVGGLVAVYFFNGSADALLSLLIFFLIDIAVIFWLATALSTPSALKYIVPGSFWLRRTLLKLR